ncbi:MAG: endonuclease [Bacteroidales bacterium]|nr:endonuclease [Bacteroidales bacterium]
MKKTTFSILLLWGLIFFSPSAQIPINYYSSAEGKIQATLKTALSNIILTHTERSYANLWTDFQTTDKRADGKVWDIYSITTNYVFVTNQCGNYSGEGSCYNREHSFPKSWFNDGTPMYTDLFHLYPSDGYVNGRRGNDPFGEVASPSYSSANGYSKLGTCTFPGYSGSVFEPNDELKGDLARSYFYMVTAYESVLPSWPGSDQIVKNTYPSLSAWSIELFLKWSRQDPVSQKEINRNNAIYNIQHNRNPFIDYPQLAENIWGNKQSEAFSSLTGIEDHLYTPTIYYANSELIIEDFTSEGTISIYNLQGKLIHSSQIFTGTNRISVEVKNTFIAVISSNKGTYSKKITPEKN